MTDFLSIFLRAVFAHDYSKYDVLFEQKENFLIGEKNVLLCEALVRIILNKEYPHLTEEKISQIMSLYRDVWQFSPNADGDRNFFYVLVHFTDNKVCLHGQQLRVKFEELLRWRQLACDIGEDFLSCAWLAYRFRWTNQEKWNENWDISCGVDDPDLQYLYRDKGLVDLHHHLKASTDVFSISWICLMNHVTHRYHTFGKIDAQIPELYKSCYRAAYIRTILYEYSCENSISESVLDIDDIYDSMNEDSVRNLQYHINILTLENGGRRGCAKYDYALPQYVDNNNIIEHIFDGERSLIYGILRTIFRGGENCETLSQLFFCYIQAKTSVRTYMVQNNNRVGFSNFSIYERRKDMFLHGYPEYEQLLTILPVIEGVRFHHLKYLETRITPKTDMCEMSESVRSMVNGWAKLVNYDVQGPKLITHFIKRNEEECKLNCERHHKLRAIVKRQTLSLMTLRRTSRVLFERLVGIDAANTELDCRPEVFAHAYRYVRKHADDENTNSEVSIKSLHYTYHVGEDFYDIVDGLRAIDEAVHLLELSRGDRLGHCIALGIDALAYYRKYEFKVVCKKQYLLDNIVWMISQADKYGVRMPSDLKMKLCEKYHILVCDLFGRNVDINTYRMSMLLRGDDPYVSYNYYDSSYGEFLRDWESCAINNDKQLTMIRNVDGVVQLYRDYHYDNHVRSEGEKMDFMTVNRQYALCVNEIQEKMMRKLSDLGIVVECCPSSNLEIGLPKRYDQQPIFRFCPIHDDNNHMAVTINTDDLGIFQTSIDNEFSIIALAALKAENEDGEKMYHRHEVLQWLEEICENGFKYSFNV